MFVQSLCRYYFNEDEKVALLQSIDVRCLILEATSGVSRPAWPAWPDSPGLVQANPVHNKIHSSLCALLVCRSPALSKLLALKTVHI